MPDVGKIENVDFESNDRFCKPLRPAWVRVGSLSIALDHLGSVEIALNRLGSLRIAFDRLESLGFAWDRLGSFELG